MNKANTTHFLEGLTWLRAIAAILVVFSHVIRASEEQYGNIDSISIPSIFYWFDLGTFGVLLFFTLSGTTLYISNRGKDVELAPFFIKRFFRIWPAFVVSLVAYALFRPVFQYFYQGSLENWIAGQYIIEYGAIELITYLTLTANFFVHSGVFNNAFWSLPVEFQYYLCFPILVWLVRKVGVIGPTIFGLALYSVYKFKLIDMPDTKVFMLGFSFCFGVAIGYLYEQKFIKFKIPFGGFLLFVVFLVASALTQYPQLMPDLPVLSGLWNWYIILASIAVALVLFNEPSLPKPIKSPFMYLGEISYSLYLWHNLVITIFLLLFINTSLLTGVWFFYGLLALTLMFTFMISKFSYEYIENPGIKLGRNLGRSFKNAYN